jgi:hypothetical protein
MGPKLKRKNVPPVASEPVRAARRGRTATQPFEQGINPAPQTLPPTVQRPVRSRGPTPPQNRDTSSPSNTLFVTEDEDEVELVGPGLDDDNDDNDSVDMQIQNALAAAEAVEEPVAADSLGSATAQSLAQSSQQCHPETQDEEVDEEPHLHWRYSAWWTMLGRNLIASAADAKRNKALHTADDDKVW